MKERVQIAVGGGSGAWPKSKQSAIPSAADVRALSEGRAKTSSQKRTRLTCACTALDTKRFLAYGLITRQATRPPYRNWVPSVHFSSSGGLTWSAQPPQSSQVMKKAVLGQRPPATTAFSCASVHCIPLVTLPAPAARSAAVSAGCSLSVASA